MAQRQREETKTTQSLDPVQGQRSAQVVAISQLHMSRNCRRDCRSTDRWVSRTDRAGRTNVASLTAVQTEDFGEALDLLGIRKASVSTSTKLHRSRAQVGQI